MPQFCLFQFSISYIIDPGFGEASYGVQTTRFFPRPSLRNSNSDFISSVKLCWVKLTTLLSFVPQQLTYCWSCQQVMKEQNYSKQKKQVEIENKTKQKLQRRFWTLKLSWRLHEVQHSQLARGKSAHLLKPAVATLSCSTAALTPAGCRSRRSPEGGAGRACLRADPGPWPSRSPGLRWGRGFLPPRSASGKSCCSVPGKTSGRPGRQGRRVSHWNLFNLFFFPPLFITVTVEKSQNQHKTTLCDA